MPTPPKVDIPENSSYSRRTANSNSAAPSAIQRGNAAARDGTQRRFREQMCAPGRGNNILDSADGAGARFAEESRKWVNIPWYDSHLVDWWTMENFSAEKYMNVCSNLAILASQSHDYRQTKLTDAGAREVIKLFKQIQQDCKEIGLKTSINYIEEVIANVKGGIISRCKQLSPVLLGVSAAIRSEMSTHLFMHILPNRADYYEQDALFGDHVNAAFPSAVRDIRSCGSCYACDRNTASVMHGMRTLECGLNTFAASLNVAFDRRNWENIINDIEAEIKKITGPQWGTDWKSKREFYSGAAKDFRYFKDAWRNHAMHFREHYEASEALTILSHIRSFMAQLADGGLKEHP